MWLHVNNCCKEIVACLYLEGGTTGIMFCHQTDGAIIAWAYNRGTKRLVSVNICSVECNSAGIFDSYCKLSPETFVVKEK